MATKKNKVIQRTRRGNGEGSIYQEKNGTWVGAIWVTNADGTKSRKKVRAHSKAEASKKLVELTGKMNIFKNSLYSNKNFGELFLDWLLIFKKPSVTPRTFEGNIRNFNLHIKPYLGNMQIENVSKATIQQLINELMAQGLAINTVKKNKFLLNQFFDYAMESGLVTTNPTYQIKVRNRNVRLYDQENEYKAIPAEYRMKFLMAINGHPFLKALCMTAMFAGLRIGEILALKWENIDFENKTINVQHGITQVPIFDDKGEIISRKTVISDTKTACSVREVPVPDILLDALKDWKKQQWVKQQLSGVDLLKPSSIVFSNDDGSVRTYYGTRVAFDRLAKKHGFFGKIHFHTLRHTYSNMLFEANENPKVIQALLGHKSVKTTLTVYNSVDKSYYKQATDKLNDLFNNEKMAEFKALEQKKQTPALQRDLDEIETDPEIIMLEKLLAEKKAQKKQHQDEM